MAALGSALALSLALGGCSPTVPDTVKIGVAMTLSGPSANRGQDLLNGAQLAVDELNAGAFKVGGKAVKFEIVARDDKGDNETAKKVAQELADQHVHAVLAHTNSPQLQAALPVYVARDMLLMSTTTQRTLIEQAGGRLFRLVPNDRVQARALASFATQQLEGKRIAALVENTDYGREMFDDVVLALKEKNLPAPIKIALEFKQSVGTEVAEQIKAMKADVAVLIAREQHALSLLESLKTAQYSDVTVLTANAARTDKVMRAPAQVRGVYATSTTIGIAELPAGERFLQTFRAKFKSEPVWGAHYTYDAVYALADTIRRANSVDPQMLQAKLRTTEPNTPMFQQMRFAPSGEQANPTIGVYKAERGTWTPQVRSASW
ncbi:MAG TPA: branched-chain amino acid ABC transporter substrate-binding protein [Burkholderiaceae bacterium]|nr:branched-chain amino acid ABC transporter substrate-binding protein [Burkholderiaceae bacterium]